VSEGEAAHLGWVMAHPACARRRVRAARVFISAGPPDLLVILGGRYPFDSCHELKLTAEAKALALLPILGEHAPTLFSFFWICVV
jgi:hypothetical protein